MITNKTIRDHIILKKMFPGSSEPTYETRTASGAIASFTTNYVAPLESCLLTLNPLQTGTGDPSPTNPRPITGFTGVNVHVADGESPHVVDNTYPIALGRTVYGGSLNVTSGELVVNQVAFDFGSEDLTWNYNAGQTRFYCTIPNIDLPTSYGEVADILCSVYKTVKFTDVTGTQTDYIIAGVTQSGTNYITCRDTRYTDAQSFKTALTGQKFVVNLATPQTYQLTPTEIATLLGENNVWHDANGDTAVSYLYQTGEGSGTDKKTFLPFFYPIRKGDI